MKSASSYMRHATSCGVLTSSSTTSGCRRGEWRVKYNYYHGCYSLDFKDVFTIFCTQIIDISPFFCCPVKSASSYMKHATSCGVLTSSSTSSGDRRGEWRVKYKYHHGCYSLDLKDLFTIFCTQNINIFTFLLLSCEVC